MQTYAIRVPKSAWREATCAEVECEAYEHGWRTAIDESTDLGQQQAHYIRQDHTRKHSESRTEAGMSVFDFEPGQRCFREHKTRDDRIDDVYAKHNGDFRGNPDGRIIKLPSAQAWVDDFGEHQERLSDEMKEGDY
jgi:hypothetical protein